MRMCALRSRDLTDGNAKGRRGLGSRLHPKRRVPARVDADGCRAPGGLFLRNIIEDHLVAVRRRVERVFHLVDAEGALVRVVTGRGDDRNVVVIMGKTLVLVVGLAGTDVGKFAWAGTPRLDEVREVLKRSNPDGPHIHIQV